MALTDSGAQSVFLHVDPAISFQPTKDHLPAHSPGAIVHLQLQSFPTLSHQLSTGASSTVCILLYVWSGTPVLSVRLPGA